MAREILDEEPKIEIGQFKDNIINDKEINAIELERLRGTWEELVKGYYNFDGCVITYYFDPNLGSESKSCRSSGYPAKHPPFPQTVDNEAIYRTMMGPNSYTGKQLLEALSGAEGMRHLDTDKRLFVKSAVYEPVENEEMFYDGMDLNLLKELEVPTETGVVSSNSVKETQEMDGVLGYVTVLAMGVKEQIKVNNKKKILITTIELETPNIADMRVSKENSITQEQLNQSNEELRREMKGYLEDVVLGYVRVRRAELEIRDQNEQVDLEIGSQEVNSEVENNNQSPENTELQLNPNSFEYQMAKREEEFQRQRLANQEALNNLRQQLARDSQTNESQTELDARISSELRDLLLSRWTRIISDGMGYFDFLMKHIIRGRQRYEAESVTGSRIGITISELEELHGEASNLRGRRRTVDQVIADMNGRIGEDPMYRVITRAIERNPYFNAQRNSSFVLRGIATDWEFSNEWYLVERIQDPVDDEWKTTVTVLKIISGTPASEEEFVYGARELLEIYRSEANIPMDLSIMDRHSIRYIN